MIAEKQLGPKCIICGREDSVDAFVNSLWLHIDIAKTPGPIDLIWVCPDCLEKTRIVAEYKQSNEELQKQNEEIAPLVEGWGKVMDIMAKLGNLIDKAKQENK